MVDGNTEFIGVIGDPVAHSLSPLLHNVAYRALGLNLIYGAFRVSVGEVRSAMMGARSLGFRGLSVTTPHKVEAAMIADQRSHEVELLGAANTIVFSGSVAVAESTDGRGLIEDLAANCDFSPRGQRCLVFGAGGAARSIILALASVEAKEIVIVNRTVAHAHQAVSLAPECARVGSLDDVPDSTLIINATSLGLSTDGASELGASFASGVGPHQLALDLVYRPTRTPFLTTAAANGARIRNGLGMLVHQAASQVQLFTGLEAPVGAMWEAVADVPSS